MQAALRIGDILVEDGAMERYTLERLADKAYGRLGDYLRAHDFIDGQTLGRAIARQHGLAFVAFDTAPPNRALFQPRDLALYQKHRYAPYARDKGTLTIATPEPSEQLRRFTMAQHGCPVRMVVTSTRDLADYYSSVAARASSRHAVHALRRKHRHLVADRIAVPHQIRGLCAMLALIASALAIAPRTSWDVVLVLCNVFYFVTLAIKLQVYLLGVKRAQALPAEEAQLLKETQSLITADLPTYTVLVPVYKESPEVIARLVKNLMALDYPKQRLDIKLICEADDSQTIFALKSQRPPQYMEIIRVPPSHPRTKPKACNVAIQQMRGEFVTIFDAEDAPAPDQLKRALVRFDQGGTQLACVQAHLNYYNRDENLLTQMFALEYGALFQLQLPALAAMACPMPLGGTSNHLRVSALREVGGWDAFNVTEDADLGVRLSYYGYRTAVLPSLTLEEAPITLGAWMRQRTRWIKGYLQTWLVFTRDRRTLKQRLGTRGYYGFQFFIGAPAATFLLAPVLWASFLISLTGYVGSPISPLLQGFCLVSFLGGIASHWLFARAVIRLEGWHHMRWALALYPFYWMLHSFAAARAVFQLLTAPHYWEKTKHGVTKILYHA